MLAMASTIRPAGPPDDPPPDPPPDPTGPAILRAVGDAAGVYRLGGVIADQKTYVSEHTIRRDITKIRIRLGSNWWGTIGTQVNIQLDGAAIKVGGVLYPLTFGGSASLVITPGTTPASDWVEIPVSTGTIIESRVCWAANTLHPSAVGSSSKWAPSARPIAPFGNYTTAGSASVPVFVGVEEGGHGALAVEGMTLSTAPSVAILGDSIAEGGDDTGMAFKTPIRTPAGFLPLALHQHQIPWTNFGVWADQPPSPGLWREGRYGDTLASFTHALCEYPINAINGGTTFNGPALNLYNFWVYVAAQGPKVWQTTLSPSNTSVNSWSTLGGQTTTTHETARLAINEWIRDGAPVVSGAVVSAGSTNPAALRAGQVGHPLSGYIEVADTVESSRNSGLWKVNGTNNYMTDDGTHPSPAAHILMAAPVAAWAATII